MSRSLSSLSQPVLRARDLVRIFGDRRVLDGVSLTVAPGTRVGLVGENGTGKSTLLRLLAGVDTPDDGAVQAPPEIGFLHQELPYPDQSTVDDMLRDALADTRAALSRLDTLAERMADDPDVLTEYGELLEWAQAHDAWDAERRATLVLEGLGLFVDGARPLGTLSGGQRSRLGLAALLIRRPDALLLDEPTNHLDDEAIAFLAEQLRALPGAVLLACHDRVFLDEVCTDIVDIDPSRAGLTRYGGAYSDYLAAKRAERARWEQQYAEEQDELKELRYAVNVTARQVAPGRPMRDGAKMAYDFKGGRVQNQVSRRVRNARQRLAELERDQVRKPPALLRFSAALDSEVDGDGLAISVRDVHLPHRLRLDRLDVRPDDKLLITGVNGAGKSTALGVLAGSVDPGAGSVARRRGLRLGLLEQDVSFADDSVTAQRIYAQTVPSGPPLSELGLLSGKDTGKPVGTLSVGQRRRLALALLIARRPQLLLLDEPTNHLSLTLADELEEALCTSPTAVVIATHDRWLRRRWTGREMTLRPA